MLATARNIAMFLVGVALVGACVLFAKDWNIWTTVIMAVIAIILLTGTNAITLITAVGDAIGTAFRGRNSTGAADLPPPPDEKG